ncbi:MAG: twin-arginine translocase subunit TatC [Solitalea-like symbiont of Acarus siro]
MKNKNIEKQQTFFDHLEVLRWHFIRIVIVFFILAVVVFLNKSYIFDTIILGPQKADFPTYTILCKIAEILHAPGICLEKTNFSIINLELTGQITIHIKASITLAIALTIPYILIELWMFIKPALKVKEKNYIAGILVFAAVLFFIGLIFGYYVLLPLTIQFLSSYSISSEIINQISLQSYLSNISTLSLSGGLIFELPVLIYFLQKIGLITASKLRSMRKYMIVISLILGALLSSPDVLSQIIVALPLYILFELSIVIAFYTERKTNNK